MKIQTKRSNRWGRRSVYLGLTLCVILTGAGCARTDKTTTTTATTTEYPNSADIGVREPYDSGTVEKSETTTATTEKRSGQRGLLSSTVNAIGWVIALPFRLVGGLIGWIF